MRLRATAGGGGRSSSSQARGMGGGGTAWTSAQSGTGVITHLASPFAPPLRMPKQHHDERAAAIAERKCNNVLSSGARAVVGGDLGCLLNIEGRLRRRGDMKTQVLHVAEVLAGETEG